MMYITEVKNTINPKLNNNITFSSVQLFWLIHELREQTNTNILE